MTNQVPEFNIVEDYRLGISVSSLMKKYHLGYPKIKEILKKYDVYKPRQIKYTKEILARILEEYETKGCGVIAKELGLSKTHITRKLRQLGKLKTERVSKKKNSKRWKRRGEWLEFKTSTKKLKWEQQKGICEWCHKPIDGPDYQSGTYHHINPIIKAQKEGWTSEQIRDISNCMLLHRECHEGNSQQLHGIDFYKFSYFNNTTDRTKRIPYSGKVLQLLKEGKTYSEVEKILKISRKKFIYAQTVLNRKGLWKKDLNYKM